MAVIRKCAAGCGAEIGIDESRLALDYSPRVCDACQTAKALTEHAAISKLIFEKLNLDPETDLLLALSELFASCDEDARRRKAAEDRLEEFTNAIAIKLTGAMLRPPEALLPLVDELLARCQVLHLKVIRSIEAAAQVQTHADRAASWGRGIQFDDNFDLRRFEKTLSQAVNEASSQQELQPDD